ncbi:hypothetical protein PIB30_037626 [Stylosanthes scabra]|uniref:Uncharacterized protein n=1 Tax=Stylosanthes scabra TaxID=79078 RepID=A0ABU6QDB6_9FABA|nr:hypothetical protein [Stylosanthes scabra]
MEVLSMFQKPRSIALEYEKPGTYGMWLIYPLDRLVECGFAEKELRINLVYDAYDGSFTEIETHLRERKHKSQRNWFCSVSSSNDRETPQTQQIRDFTFNLGFLEQVVDVQHVVVFELGEVKHQRWTPSPVLGAVTCHVCVSRCPLEVKTNGGSSPSRFFEGGGHISIYQWLGVHIYAF